MKATLKFNLDDPEDRENHLRCVKSFNMVSALWEIVHRMLKELEFIEDAGQPITSDIVGKKIIDILNDESIDLDELIT